MTRKLHFIAIFAALLGACSQESDPSNAAGKSQAADAPTTDASAVTAAIGDWGVDLSVRDESVPPGDDFNRYANGKWLDSYEIPADLSSYGVFLNLRIDAENDVRAIVEDLAATEPPQGSLGQKVGDFYAAWMNTEHLDELGAAPLLPHLEKIAAITDKTELKRAFASLHGTAPFGIGIIPDPADTSRYIAFISQDGLGMPNRDYYLKDDERFLQYRDAYRTYIDTVLTLAGVDNGGEKADAIIALESKLAEAHWTPEESRDIKKIYNPMPPAQVRELAPEFDWQSIFGELGLGGVDTFVVAQTTAIEAAGDILAATDLETWKDYLGFHLIRNHARYLSSDFDQAHYAFYSETLQGTEEQRERWKRGVQEVNAGMGEAVGQIYVERHFPPEFKAKMEDLVNNLTAAFEERLMENEWMDDETREQALLKLSTFEPRIGYTDKWTDYTDLTIEQDKLLDSAMTLAEFQWMQQVDRLAGPVDRDIWPYPPQTVNASYSPLLNQITFPAGILQPPFFDPNADPAVNYGAIGAVIGHEIGHGFDDQGRRFDEQGRIRDWWTATADERFGERTTELGSQYGEYEPIDGLTVNPDLTMGENIGDLGGVQMAYAAYHRYLDACCDGQAEELDGLSGDQRFFLSWAQVWRSLRREDALRQQILTDPHSPERYRVNGVVRNVDAWYEAFDIKPDDSLYLPEESRVRIW